MKKLPLLKMNFDNDEDDEETTIDGIKPTLDELETLESQNLKGKLVECRYCDGSGKVTKDGNLGLLAIKSGGKKPCPACGGSGYKRV